MLISQLYKITGVPILLNTSFNENEPKNTEEIILKKDDVFHVRKLNWHQIINHTKEPCRIIELQYDEEMIEEDIKRLNHYKYKYNKTFYLLKKMFDHFLKATERL